MVYAVLHADRLDARGNLAQAIGGQAREQVMLDLQVERARLPQRRCRACTIRETTCVPPFAAVRTPSGSTSRGRERRPSLKSAVSCATAATQKVYDTTRLMAADPTRLFIDARFVSEWRSKGFHAVLPDPTQPDSRRSVLFRMLELKHAHPLAPDTNLSENFSFGLEREATCVASDKFDEYAQRHPLWGMPYGLPGLPDEEVHALTEWLNAGAPSPNIAPLSAALEREIANWEAFFNEPSNKRRLVARYIYEHLFLASLHFREAGDGMWWLSWRKRKPASA